MELFLTIEWQNIKSFNNSQNNAFEELICQLAREESIPNRKEFYRIAAPDGGVEAYCILDNGDEYGWQAKYFSSMGTSQWSQLKESFETALLKHPNLTKYYICIPLDRQDPRIKKKSGENQLWFMDKWNEYTKKWIEYAKTQGRNVTFEYWGSSELVHRLSEEKHAGRRLFWFSKEEFSNAWFKSHVKNSVKNLGHRYTAQLNVELDISKNFDALSRNNDFRTILKDEFHLLFKALNNLKVDALKDEEVNDAISSLYDQFDISKKTELHLFDISLINTSCNVIQNYLRKYQRSLEENKDSSSDSVKYEIHHIDQALIALYEFKEFSDNPMIKLANKPVMLLSGEPGIGKSHLLADIALNRLNQNKVCLFLLGQHLTSEESPWTQILSNSLRLKCNEHEFLGALNAKAEAQGERLLFIVDAINEGKGLYFWKNHIAGFINDFSKYPWLSLVLSIRSSCQKLLVPERLIPNDKAIRIAHHGFENVEYQASSLFFSHYGIEQPSIPLLHPEFSNPLFLKLFCEGLNRSGYRRVPKGYSGITVIIDFFLESVDEKLSNISSFKYPSGRHLVRRVIDSLIEYKLKNNESFIPYEDAFDIADKVLSKFSNERGFIEALISEGVLSKNVFWLKDNEYKEGIYFAYERFEDHFTVAYLLENSFDKEEPEQAFKEDGALAKYIENNYRHQGIVEALSIQIPEIIDKELYDLVPVNVKVESSIAIAFINSLIWRKPETIKENVKVYINQHILKYEHTFDLFFQMVYSVSSDPEHFFNADRLHLYLMQSSLADRDAEWTTYLHDKNYQGSAMQRLIDWALQDENKSYLSVESRLLAGKALAWLFTSTNISFRDSATKGLVCILENNIKTIELLLIGFQNVNDPYVYERIFAAAYGAVLISDDLQGLDKLSQYILDTIFEQEDVYPNVLVRDYARNIIEYALHKDSFKFVNIDIIRPPYKSEFPKTFPSNEEIDAYKIDNIPKETYEYVSWSQDAILSSMVTGYGRGTGGYGDFGRYTFRSAVHQWGDFNDNDLSNYACKLIFEKYGYDMKKHGKFDEHASSGDRHRNKTERIGKKYQWLALYEVLARLLDNYKMSEGWKENKKYFWYQGTWEPFVRNIDPTSIQQREKKTTADNQQTWWSKVKYNDWNEDHLNWLVNAENLPSPLEIIERIDDQGNEWLVFDIDCIWDEPTPIGYEKHETPHKHLWYQIKSYLVHEDKAEDLIPWAKQQHLMGKRYFPKINDQYEVFTREYYWSPAYHFFDDPYYGRTHWEEVYERHERKNLRDEPKLTIKDYSPELFEELESITEVSEEDFSDDRLSSTLERYPPELLEKLEVTAKEVNNPPEDKLIGEVMITTERHRWESGAEYEDQPSYLAPREFMYEKMQLKYSKNIGEWLNSQNDEVVCFDPSVKHGDDSCLLVRKDALLKFLEENKLKIFWTCLGEKEIYGDSHNSIAKWLELSGVFTITKNTVTGNLKPYIQSVGGG